MPTVPRGHAPGRSALTLPGTEGPRQANLPSGGSARLLLRVLEVPLLLLGPFMVCAAAFLATDEPTTNRWIMAVAGVGVTASSVGLVRYEARLRDRARRDLRRLETVGVAATAEITAIRPTSLGEEEGIELSLLISGPGFAPFGSASQCKDHPALKVGARLNAVVDPSDGLYVIVA
ncbi:hypothetical protein [Micromonospora sagamiensis]|uniref:Uncharacterized protein n=1 Tax=Micromonospora sagamiensis TaxID=47875 RepID=A0A562WH70_9ACTN|nr:hypothetical protein [Micromonospora sagamiensis]TWJ29660.1 hypothetical protein JD81_03171 [Micromonospora sagamiensis]BCL17308.1 hypothetical protein GCM10017556_50470 [Micromonospora sagamiensis]